MNILPGSKEELRNGNYNIRLYGTPPFGNYTPLTLYIASTWFFEKKVINTVGYWKTEDRTYETPSQEWLFRAWKKGISIGFSKKISVITLFSGHRKNSYMLKESYEHEFFYNKLDDSQFISNLFERLAVTLSADLIKSKHYQPVRSFLLVLRYPIYRLFVKLGINPRAVKTLIRYGGKGKLIEWHRKYTGIENP
ncbi:MAG: hypothetical protein WD431_17275 [Cyclobacteriaceae bacterium]